MKPSPAPDSNITSTATAGTATAGTTSQKKSPKKNASNKTTATAASVDDYVATRATTEQLADCYQLITLCQHLTAQSPVMWGPSMVGFGRYQYTYDSGRSGESFCLGFAVRGRELVIYLLADGPAQAALLAKLGPHKIGKACLYIKRLADIDLNILQLLMAESLAELARRHHVLT
jgi:hypothetical protein